MKTGILPVLLCLLVTGCASTEYASPPNRSPTGALLRGEIAADNYLEAIKQANVQAREQEQFEVNKEQTRAYNTQTGRFEYVPEGTIQKWNETNQRWEFTPARQPRES